MMPFVEHDPARGVLRVAGARGIHHHQRMVGDDEIGSCGCPGRAFDEALAVVRTSGIDAFAPLICQCRDATLAEQGAQPAGQIAADHVTILGIGRPARHQMRQDRCASGEPALQCVFEVEQAQIVLAPLSHHDRLASHRRALPARHAPPLLAKLTLKVLGERRHPYRTARPFVPRGRRGLGSPMSCRYQCRPAPTICAEYAAFASRVTEDRQRVAWRSRAAPRRPLRAFAGQPGEVRRNFGFLYIRTVAGCGQFGESLLHSGKRENSHFSARSGFADRVDLGLVPKAIANACQRLQRRPGTGPFCPVANHLLCTMARSCSRRCACNTPEGRCGIAARFRQGPMRAHQTL